MTCTYQQSPRTEHRGALGSRTMERPPVSGAGDDSPESKTLAFTPCVVRQSTTSGIVTPNPIKGRAAKPSADTDVNKSPSKRASRVLDAGIHGINFHGISISEAQHRRAALQESFKNRGQGAEARLMKELDEGPAQLTQQKEMDVLEAELEMEPFVIKVQRAFRLVKFVYMKFGPLLFVDNKTQSSYGQIKFRQVTLALALTLALAPALAVTLPLTLRQVLKPASWISVEPNVSVRRLVKFMDYYWELPKPEVLVTITGGAQDFALAPDLHMAFDRGIINVGQSAKAWFITSGSDTGVMKHVGSAMCRHDVRLRLSLRLSLRLRLRLRLSLRLTLTRRGWMS